MTVNISDSTVDNPKPAKIPKLDDDQGSETQSSTNTIEKYVNKQTEQNGNTPITPVPKDGDRLRCMFLLPHKHGRQCKMTRRKGDKFCALHKNTDPSATDPQARVPCPIDPKHTVLKKKLDAHIKKCNAARPEEIPEWFELDKNIVAKDTTTKSEPQAEVEFTQQDYEDMKEKLQKLWSTKLKNDIPQLEQLSHQGVYQRL